MGICVDRSEAYVADALMLTLMHQNELNQMQLERVVVRVEGMELEYVLNIRSLIMMPCFLCLSLCHPPGASSLFLSLCYCMIVQTMGPQLRAQESELGTCPEVLQERKRLKVDTENNLKVRR